MRTIANNNWEKQIPETALEFVQLGMNLNS